MFFTSCDNDIENWYSATFDYSGRFVVATTCEEYESDNTVIEEGLEVMIYNTAANVSDEIWLDFEVAGLPQKGKIKLSGTAQEASGTATVENISSSDYLIDTEYGLAPFSSGYESYFRVPEKAGELNDGIKLYTRMTLESLKITPKAATTIGGNTADGIYVKVILHHDYIQFESYRTDPETWDDPDVPEYAWAVKPGTNTPADADDWDETWTLTGYRYTGYPEDRP
jgi:hypothetical protein